MKHRAARTTQSSRSSQKLMKTKALKASAKAKLMPPDPDAAAKLAAAQILRRGACSTFSSRSFIAPSSRSNASSKAPARNLRDRAQVHLRICEQRISRLPAPAPKSAEDHYTQGVALMNLGRWDEAREHLDRARKAAPKADHVVYAMAALDCLTGEADSAMENLKIAIQLRPENRYHARNDEDFAFLQEDPRFTELLYPERDGSGG